MRHIIKGPPPNSFVYYVHQMNATFEDMDANVKDDLQVALLDEQGWVCGYCQQKIADVRKMKVEHCERSICNGENGSIDRRLDYTNLMAVCLGDSGTGVLHCDSSKAQFNSTNGLPIRISPWISAHIAGIKYTSTGMIKSSNPDHDEEINRILNLNAAHLKSLRKMTYSSVYEKARNNKDKMRRILSDALDYGNNRFTNNFPGLYVYMMARLRTHQILAQK